MPLALRCTHLKSRCSHECHDDDDHPGSGQPVVQRAPLRVDQPYVLVTPTYGGGDGHGAVPKQVIKFLNDEKNRSLCRGVISAGNTNFGTAYCKAGEIVAGKVGVPHLYRFELLGTNEDVSRVQEGLRKFWSTTLYRQFFLTIS